MIPRMNETFAVTSVGNISVMVGSKRGKCHSSHVFLGMANMKTSRRAVQDPRKPWRRWTYLRFKKKHKAVFRQTNYETRWCHFWEILQPCEQGVEYSSKVLVHAATHQVGLVDCKHPLVL